MPRVTYSFDQTEIITAYDFVTLKPLGKSPSGQLVPLAVAIVFESGVVKVYDTYQSRNLLFQITVGKDVQAVTSSGSQDEMYLVVLTKDGQVLIFDIALERKFSANQEQRHLDDDTAGFQSADSISKVKTKKKAPAKVEMIDPYQQLLQLFEYRAQAPHQVNLTQKDSYDPVAYEELMAYTYKTERYILVSDSKGGVSILKQKTKGEQHNTWELRSRLQVSTQYPILGISKSQTSVMFVTVKRLLFLRMHEGQLSQKTCQITGHGIDTYDIANA